MRLLIAAFAMLPVSAATAEPPAPPERPLAGQPIQGTMDPKCPKALAYWGTGPGKAQMHKLTELPPAEAFHAVYRTDKDGCLDPVLVGYQYGRRR